MAKPSDLTEWAYVPSLQRPLPYIITEFMFIIKQPNELTEKERFHLAQSKLLGGVAIFFIIYGGLFLDLIPIPRPRYSFLEFLFLVVVAIIGLFTLNTYIVHKLRKGESAKIPVLGAIADMAKNSNFWFLVAYLSPAILLFASLGLIILVY